VTLKILIGRFSRNFFLRTAEGSNISAISWRPVLVVEEAGQPPTIGKQLVNFIIRVYGIKYKIFHEQVFIKMCLIVQLSNSIFMCELEMMTNVCFYYSR
jgi:hypothetical protein